MTDSFYSVVCIRALSGAGSVAAWRKYLLYSLSVHSLVMHRVCEVLESPVEARAVDPVIAHANPDYPRCHLGDELSTKQRPGSKRATVYYLERAIGYGETSGCEMADRNVRDIQLRVDLIADETLR